MSELNLIHEEAICHQLQEIIRKWIFNTEKASVKSLSRKAKVNEGVIRRIVNDGILPHAVTIVKILLAIVDSNKIEGLKSIASPSMMTYLISEIPFLESDLQTHKTIEAATFPCNEIQSIIRNWLNADPKRTIAQLGRDSKIGEYNIRRLMHENRLIHISFVFELLKTIYSFESLQDLGEFCSTELCSFISKELPNIDKRIIAKPSPNFNHLENLLSDIKLFHLYYLIDSFNGISETELSNEVGSGYQSLLKILLDNKIVAESPEGLFFRPLKNTAASSDRDLNKKILEAVLNLFFRTDELNNVLFVLNDSLSVEGYQEAQRLITELFYKLDDLTKTHSGDIPFVAGAFTDILTSQKKSLFLERTKNLNS